MTKRRWLALPASLAIVLAACSSGGGASSAPASAAPVSQAPASVAPASQAPASEAPASEAPPEAVKIGFVTHVAGQPVHPADHRRRERRREGPRRRPAGDAGPEGGDADAQLKAVQTSSRRASRASRRRSPANRWRAASTRSSTAGMPVVQFNLLEHRPSRRRTSASGRSRAGASSAKKVVEKLGGAERHGQGHHRQLLPGLPGAREPRQGRPGIAEGGARPQDPRAVRRQGRGRRELRRVGALLAANPDAKALVGLCAPDIASLGKLKAANARQRSSPAATT